MENGIVDFQCDESTLADSSNLSSSSSLSFEPDTTYVAIARNLSIESGPFVTQIVCRFLLWSFVNIKAFYDSFSRVNTIYKSRVVFISHEIYCGNYNKKRFIFKPKKLQTLFRYHFPRVADLLFS